MSSDQIYKFSFPYAYFSWSMWTRDNFQRICSERTNKQGSFVKFKMFLPLPYPTLRGNFSFFWVLVGHVEYHCFLINSYIFHYTGRMRWRYRNVSFIVPRHNSSTMWIYFFDCVLYKRYLFILMRNKKVYYGNIVHWHGSTI